MVQPAKAPYEVQEDAVTTADGQQLHLRTWQPTGAAAKGRLVIVHGYQEYGGRYQQLACQLVARGLQVVTFDLRGHGRSTGVRGHVRRFADYVDDLTAVLRHVQGTPLPTAVLGHSLGGLITLAGASQPLPGVVGTVVVNPYLALAMPMPRLKRWLGLATGRLLPRLATGNGIDPRWLSRDPEVLAAYRNDPLLLNRVTAGWLVQTLEAQRQVLDRPQLPCPLLFVYSDADPIASPQVNAAFAERLRCPDKTVLRRHGELHEPLQDNDRLALGDTIGDWLGRCFAAVQPGKSPASTVSSARGG